MTPLHSAARAYASRFGWPVFPLLPRRKVPFGALVPNGVLQATTDERAIDGWWNRAPNANVGIACGRGFFVVDVDPRNGGDETLGQLEAKHGALPETVRGLTGGGGQHLLFHLDDGQKLRGSLGEGLDVKGVGGVHRGAPSVHPDGPIYQWDIGAHPLETAIARAPDWLMRALSKPMSGVARDPSRVLGTASQSFLARCFEVAGWLGNDVDAVRVMARCPWVHEHSTDDRGQRTGDGNDSSTVIFAATIENPLGRFHCSHGHCVGTRATVEAMRELPTAAARVVATQDPKLAELAIHTLIRWAR